LRLNAHSHATSDRRNRVPPVLRRTQHDEYDLFSYDAARHTIVQHPDSSEALPDVAFKRCQQ